MEFWDEDRNTELHYLSLGLSAAEAEGLANKLRAVRGVTTFSYHEIELSSGDHKLVFYVHPEDAINV